MIRTARNQDIKQIVALGQMAWGESRFSEASGVDVPLSKGILLNTIAGDTTAAIVSEENGILDGVILGNVSNMYEVTDLPVVTHHLWYVTPGARPGTAMKLLDALHDWAGPSTLKRHLVHDAIVDPEKSRKLFERRGYRLAGYLYEKED